MSLHNLYTKCAPSVHRSVHMAASLIIALAASASAMLTFSAPVAAGDFTAPAGCEGWLTVQQRSCRVSNHYRCEADSPGDTWRIDFGVNGPYYRGRIDYETQWMESHLSDGSTEVIQIPARDPASFTELLETGHDSYDFTLRSSNGLRRDVRGYDSLVGETVVIDGVTLMRTKYELTATYSDGSLSYHSRGNEYIHPRWRIFLSGAGQTDLGEGFLPRDFTPVEFIFPGEEGFFTTTPKYDCELLTADGPAPAKNVVPASYPQAAQ